MGRRHASRHPQAPAPADRSPRWPAPSGGDTPDRGLAPGASAHLGCRSIGGPRPLGDCFSECAKTWRAAPASPSVDPGPLVVSPYRRIVWRHVNPCLHLVSILPCRRISLSCQQPERTGPPTIPASGPDRTTNGIPTGCAGGAGRASPWTARPHSPARRRSQAWREPLRRPAPAPAPVIAPRQAALRP